jgi:hypothetical protein
MTGPPQPPYDEHDNLKPCALPRCFEQCDATEPPLERGSTPPLRGERALTG